MLPLQSGTIFQTMALPKKKGRIFFFFLPATTDNNDNSRGILQGLGDLLDGVRLPMVMAGDCRGSPAGAASTQETQDPAPGPAVRARGCAASGAPPRGTPPAAFPLQLESKILWVLTALTVGQSV